MEPNEVTRWKQTPAFVHKAIFDLRLTVPQLVVYFYIVAHTDRKTQKAFPGVRKIAARFKMNKNTVASAVKRLEKLNLIKKTRERRGSAVVYEITSYSDWRFAGALVSDEKERLKSVPPVNQSVPASVPALTNSSIKDGSKEEVIGRSDCPSKATKEQLIEFAKSRDFLASDGIYVFEKLEARAWRIAGSQIKDAFAYFREQESAKYLPSQKREKTATRSLYGVG